ncbi:hypothetical protein [Granulicella paludicola]|uniref:hypothetical protein n=1 Tax=Granulicella paludicola TaxID=474951 RepID=UPI0021E009AC|nr:hypothetical protein [Granulicella paludicola]
MRFSTRLSLSAIVAATLLAPLQQTHAQASAIPSAQAGPESQPASGETSKGRKKLDEMVQALGGDAWLNREDWAFEGRAATFYKGLPHQDAPQFEEYYRANPVGERVIIITHSGLFIATNHKDLAEVWTKDNGYEITYRGSHPLPEKDVADYMRRRAHSLETVVHDWLKRPDTLITYEGTNMVERRLAEQVSVVTADNDAVTIELEEATHLPLSISFQWHDPIYKDLNHDEQQLDDYHLVQGIQTPYSITYLHNGDMTQQRFFTKITYNQHLPADLFDPNRPLMKRVK